MICENSSGLSCSHLNIEDLAHSNVRRFWFWYAEVNPQRLRNVNKVSPPWVRRIAIICGFILIAIVVGALLWPRLW